MRIKVPFDSLKCGDEFYFNRAKYLKVKVGVVANRDDMIAAIVVNGHYPYQCSYTVEYCNRNMSQVEIEVSTVPLYSIPLGKKFQRLDRTYTRVNLDIGRDIIIGVCENNMEYLTYEYSKDEQVIPLD